MNKERYNYDLNPVEFALAYNMTVEQAESKINYYNKEQRLPWWKTLVINGICYQADYLGLRNGEYRGFAGREFWFMNSQTLEVGRTNCLWMGLYSSKPNNAIFLPTDDTAPSNPAIFEKLMGQYRQAQIDLPNNTLIQKMERESHLQNFEKRLSLGVFCMIRSKRFFAESTMQTKWYRNGKMVDARTDLINWLDEQGIQS